ncbi:PfkB family carbohydrate kinase [uncultured Cohaesibacter sp.]|uniref:PfkB family carbohydrate kinase n=1 Tax=uncultured Cohaesibacter sp. TaxID=1002546 RepID=UPI0029C85812|nr:PfkB family carbohydrate kinase [uncultured Cohaesibacter sp.]
MNPQEYAPHTRMDQSGAKRIVTLGNAFLDTILLLPTLPDKPLKMRVMDVKFTGGGIAATAACAAARLGADVTYWGRLGVDDIGDRIVERLNQFNVRTDHVTRIEGGRSPMGTILLAPDGERTALGFIGQNLGEDAGWLPLDLLDGVSGVLADYSWWQGAKALFEGANQRGIVSVLDADVGDLDAVSKLLTLPDHLVFSSECLRRLTDCAKLEDAILKADGMCRGTVSATDGARGFFWCDDGRVQHVPAFEIEAIDTNGAGDIFHGAFTLGLAENMRIEDAARFASAAAALKCASGSGWESIPDRSQVETLINGGRK